MDVEERIDWEQIISETAPASDLQMYVDDLDPESGGRAVHSWLEAEFEDMDGLRFEGYCYDHERDYKGQFDAFDGDLTYEFKTKSSRGMMKAPYEDDLDQLNEYLHALEVDHGVLVYISRNDVTNVDEYLVERYPLDD